MANDRNDFAPEIRNSAWWASDTRRAVNNRAVDVILEKQGKKEIADLSHIEAVQMGHVMQPVIGRLASERLNMELKDADYSLTHPQHDWLRSHFDFISSDGKVLVEAKNYAAGTRNKYDADTSRIPDADYFQLLHECTVHGVDIAYLAVLFGGQEFLTFKFSFTPEQKEEFIKKMAQYWGYVKAGTVPEPQDLDQTKLVYPTSNDAVIMANQEIEVVIQELKELKKEVKRLEEFAEAREVYIRNVMKECAEIRTVDGTTLATWKSSKPSMRFNAELFKQAYPDLYNQFVTEMAGARRFLIK